MGTGIIDYPGQFRALAEDGYEGLLSLETHYETPDGGAEKATRESLAVIRELCEEAGIRL
jgi:sugar phosphate isomerase/epimerase